METKKPEGKRGDMTCKHFVYLSHFVTNLLVKSLDDRSYLPNRGIFAHKKKKATMLFWWMSCSQQIE